MLRSLNGVPGDQQEPADTGWTRFPHREHPADVPQCECRVCDRLNRFWGCTRMMPLRGLSRSAMR